jgi:hypothetical protein
VKALVIGGGGREHALAWKLAQAERVQAVFVAPGNAGTAAEPHVRNVAITDLEELAAFAVEEKIDLTVVGPEAALAAGAVDIFRARGLRIFGPTRAAAELESSKAFAKDFMRRHAIPTAAYEVFDDAGAAHRRIAAALLPIVVKADGLAAGKGVVVAATREEAHAAIDSMLGGSAPAGSRVVLEEFLAGRRVPYVVQRAQGSGWAERRYLLDAVKRWYENGWKNLDRRLQSSITEGVVVFLSLFDDNPAINRTFCPPRTAYFGEQPPGAPKPLPPLEDLLETGRVLALNFPVGMNPGLARALGVMLKLDFQRAVLQRIPRISANPTRVWRDLVFICDEYHAFATVGETDPTGDERTFALSRQARLIPIVATQSISSLRSALPGEESWRTLLQCFRTKLFLATSDEFTAKNAAELCGRRDRLKAHYSLSEAGQWSHVSLLTGRPTASKHTLSASKSYAPHHEYIFAPRVFTELQNAQAIALPYDGFNPLPPQFCYLKPHYLDVNTSYFDHLAEGRL